MARALREAASTSGVGGDPWPGNSESTRGCWCPRGEVARGGMTEIVGMPRVGLKVWDPCRRRRGKGDGQSAGELQGKQRGARPVPKEARPGGGQVCGQAPGQAEGCGTRAAGVEGPVAGGV